MRLGDLEQLELGGVAAPARLLEPAASEVRHECLEARIAAHPREGRLRVDRVEVVEALIGRAAQRREGTLEVSLAAEPSCTH